MSTPTARRRPRRRSVLPLVAACLALAAVPALATVRTPDGPDLAIATRSDRAAYAPGETIAYLITVTNAGTATVPVADVVVSDPQLADLTPAGRAKDGALEPGESLDWTGTRATSAADCGMLQNTATVELRGDKTGPRDVDPANDGATRVVEVTGAACAPPAGVTSAASRPASPPYPAIQEAVPQSEAAASPPPRLRAAVRGPRTLGPCARRPVSLRLRAHRTTAGRRALSARATARCGWALSTARMRVAER